VSVRVTDRDFGLGALAADLRRLGGPRLVVGVEAAPGSRLDIAATVNEFGSTDGRIPQRSYFRSTMDRERLRYGTALAWSLRRVLDGRSLWRRELHLLGSRIANDIAITIHELDTPPNAPSTIQKKGFDNPLVETGTLARSIDHEVLG